MGYERRNREPFLGASDTAKNMPDQAEHHAYPAAPFHALPAVHRVLAPCIAVHREIVGGFLCPHRAVDRSHS